MSLINKLEKIISDYNLNEEKKNIVLNINEIVKGFNTEFIVGHVTWNNYRESDDQGGSYNRAESPRVYDKDGNDLEDSLWDKVDSAGRNFNYNDGYIHDLLYDICDMGIESFDVGSITDFNLKEMVQKVLDNDIS